MIKTLIKIIGKRNYLKLEQLKKTIFPTKYDKQQKTFFEQQVRFYASFIRENNLCFDIGGNVGDKAAIFLNLNAKVVIVEPQDSCVKILNEKFGDMAIILQKGAGSLNTIKEFYVANNSQISSFEKDWITDLKDTRFTDVVVQKVENIEIITLDNLIETYGNPDFIKIDVEGYELEVLKGLNKKFTMLSFEYAVPEKLEDAIKCLVLLKNKYTGLTCNYTVGNCPAAFNLNNWVSIDEMLNYVQEDYFRNSFAGDIFVKNLQV
jgi:FkbM family methyltransferase